MPEMSGIFELNLTKTNNLIYIMRGIYINLGSLDYNITRFQKKCNFF